MLSRLAPLAKLTRNPTLRRCGIGFALFNAAEYGEWIAVLVYAYNQGGAKASGILAAAQLLPCVVIAPLLATFADRYQAGRVLVAGYAAQAVGMGLLAIALLAHAPPAVVYVFAILAAPAFNATRPTMNVVLPAGRAHPRRADRRKRGAGLDRERRHHGRPGRCRRCDRDRRRPAGWWRHSPSRCWSPHGCRCRLRDRCRRPNRATWARRSPTRSTGSAHSGASVVRRC